MSEAPVATATARFDDFEFDFESSELRKSGSRIRLQEQPAKILAILLQNAGRIITRDELRQAIWPAGTFVDFDHSLNTAIAKLRTALGDTADAPRYVETVARHGYRFMAEVTRVAVTATEVATLSPTESPAAKPGQISPIAGSRRWPGAALAVLVLVALVATLLLRPDRESTVLPTPAPQTPPASPRTIAILPIANDDPDSQHTSDGIARHLIDDLSTSPALRVTAPTSAFRFKKSRAEPLEIGRKLGVSCLLTGTLTESAGQHTLRVELIDARDGAQIWAREYVHPSDDIMGLQRRLEADVSRRLGVTRADRPPATRSAEAYDLYLRGRFLWNLRGRDNLGRALDALEQSVKLDPSFAQAWGGLALAYGTIAGNRYLPGTENEFHDKAQMALQKALALDPSNFEAWTSRAAAKSTHDWDFAGAEADYRRAIELNPSYATAHQWYAQLLRALDRTEEARAEIELAQQLDPFSVSVNMGACFDRLRRREYRQALAEARRVRDIDPTIAPRLCMYWCQILLGDYEAATEQFRVDNPAIADEAMKALKTDGTPAYWRGFIRRAGEQHYDAAMGYSMLGDSDNAFAELEKAFEVRGRNFEEFYSDPRFDAIRDDPRFDALALRVGLPQVQHRQPPKSNEAVR